MPVLGADYRRDMEIRRYPVLAYGLVPLIALVLQAWLPRLLGRYVWFDLPLVVTVYFALGRRSPIQGTLMGASMGLFEDALSHHAIGVNGIAKTVVGYGASSLGAKLDVENAGARLLVTLGFYLIHAAVYFTVARGMVNMTLDWSWSRGILAGLANAVVGVALYFVLDKFKQRT